MVGGVKTRAFEHNANRLVDLLQGFLAAFRAASQWLIAKGLLFIELDSAVGAAVCVDRHASIFFLGSIPITGG